MYSFFRQIIFTGYFWERLISCTGIIVILYILRDFMMFFLMTFFFAYLFYSVTEWLQRHLSRIEKRVS